MKHLPKKYYMISVFISGQMHGPVLVRFCSTVLLVYDLLFTFVDLLLLLTNTLSLWNIIVFSASDPERECDH